MRKTIWIRVLVCSIILSVVPAANALEVAGEDLGVNLDFTFASKYMWHGYDTYDDHAAFQPSVTFSYMGFNAGVWGSWPASSGYEVLTELDYYIGYDRSFFEESTWQVDASLLYTYFDYPKTNSSGDVQEIALSLSMPNLIPLGPSSLVPGYVVYYDWDGIQDSDLIDDGWFHDFTLSYDVPIPALISTQEEQALTLSAGVTYNDGAFGSGAGFSHAQFGVETTFEWNAFYLTPAVYYQWSWEDSVNDEDELFATISVGYDF
ncbi:MAG: hypothetical protein GC154_15060 [bacterium]|nr:hypothetical protein [bacterium]